MKYEPGQTIRYISYGEVKTGVVARIGASGIIFLTTGRFVFAASVVG